MSRYVETVLGPVRESDMGFTLPHEHTFATWHDPAFYVPDDLGIFAFELGEFRERGGSCIVDVTVRYAGRAPDRVRALSERVGIHIVLATGFYTEEYHEPDARVDRRSVDSLADEMIGELTIGIDQTAMKAGVIKIGCWHSWVSAQEERVHRAAAHAQRETGKGITTHSLFSRVGLQELDLLIAEGADPARIAIGHCGSCPEIDYYYEIMSRGAFVQFDFWGNHAEGNIAALEARVFDLLVALLRDRKEGQILLSHDNGFYATLKTFGGNGYTYIQENVLPRLVAAGVSQKQIDCMTITNPRRLLAS